MAGEPAVQLSAAAGPWITTGAGGWAGVGNILIPRDRSLPRRGKGLRLHVCAFALGGLLTGRGDQPRAFPCEWWLDLRVTRKTGGSPATPEGATQHCLPLGCGGRTKPHLPICGSSEARTQRST